MRVLVTGAGGLVGGAVAHRLATARWEVVGISRGQADLASETVADRLSRELEPCQAIVHAAACLSQELEAPDIPLTNCLGTQQMLRLARLWRAGSFVFLSSVAVIGRPRQIPITEEHPVEPLTAYHASKLFGEHLVRLAAGDPLATVTLRLTAPVGPGMPEGRILANFVRRALAHQPLLLVGRGTRRQNYVDVRDAAAAVESCLRHGVTGLFHIASRECISNQDLAEQCIRCLGSSSSIRFSGEPDTEDDMIWEVSIAQAAERFGYSPAFSVEDSIRAVASHYAH